MHFLARVARRDVILIAMPDPSHREVESVPVPAFGRGHKKLHVFSSISLLQGIARVRMKDAAGLIFVENTDAVGISEHIVVLRCSVAVSCGVCDT